MPAAPATVADYLAECAEGLRPATLSRRAAAVRHVHLIGRHASPTDSVEVKETLKGIRRNPEKPLPVIRDALTHDLVRRMLDSCGMDMKDLRDRALLAIGFAAALRRSELVALRVEDVRWVEDGIRLTIVRSKTDQEAQGHEVAIPHGSKIRPVRALRLWLEASGVADGHLFRHVRRGGHITADGLDGHAVGRIVKARCAAAGISPDTFSAHSLRNGFLTSGAMTGASIFKLKEVSRHKSVETLSGYVKAPTCSVTMREVRSYEEANWVTVAQGGANMGTSEATIPSREEECPTCGRLMSVRARLCPTCRSYRQQWKNWLSFYGSGVGLVAIIISAVTFVSDVGPHVWASLFLPDAIKAAYFEYPGTSVFVNIGPHDIIVQSISLAWRFPGADPVELPVGQLVKAGESAAVKIGSQYDEPKEVDQAKWVRGNEAAQGRSEVHDAFKIGVPERCAVFHVYNDEHPFFQLLNRLRRQPLIKVPAQISIHEYRVSSKQAVAERIRGETAFLAIPGCEPSSSGNSAQ